MRRICGFPAWLRDPDAGWDARLWRRWALFTALAYAIILAVVLLLASVGLDATQVALDEPLVGTLLIATAGALFYGRVLGALQWRVVRERVPMPRRPWVRACVAPALIVWIAVVIPAAVHAETTDGDLRVAYFLAVSQALALGPLIGFMQAEALRPYTRRWAWWIAANLVSYLAVDTCFWVLSLLFGGFDLAHGEGSPLEAFLVLVAAAPLSGRMLLWVTAPRALAPSSRSGARNLPS